MSLPPNAEVSPRSYTTRSTYSSSSTNRTVTRNGGQPETSSESTESSSSASSGDPISPISTQFPDNFEDLKRSILSGDAYKRCERIHQEVAPQRGQQQYKPDQGVTTIRPVRSLAEIPIQPVRAQRAASVRSTPSPKKTTLVTDCNSKTSGTSPTNTMSNYKTELYIPVRRHHGDFDDFFKNRWLEHNTSNMDTEFDRKRHEWESKLDDMKRGFFDFSPFADHNSRHYESTNAIQPFSQPFDYFWGPPPIIHPTKSLSKLFGPSGNPEFAVRFNVKDFKPEEINVSTKGGRLTIAATHEEKTGNSTSRREFKRTVDIPSDVQIGLMRSTLSKDGILSITAPIRPPNYLPGPAVSPGLQSSSQITQQHANAVSTMPVSAMSVGSTGSSVVTREADTGDALNYSLSIAGYQPQEVTVSVEGRKVTVHAKHDENTGGRKVHNEMTKSFDLPPTVDAHQIRSYIKDGSTLFIEAHLRDDLVGKIHLVPVTHKVY